MGIAMDWEWLHSKSGVNYFQAGRWRLIGPKDGDELTGYLWLSFGSVGSELYMRKCLRMGDLPSNVKISSYIIRACTDDELNFIHTFRNFLKEKNGLPTKPLPKFRRKRKNRKINNKQPGQEKKDTIKVLKPSLPKGRKKKKTQNLKPKKIDKALRKSSKKKFDSSRGLN